MERQVCKSSKAMRALILIAAVLLLCFAAVSLGLDRTYAATSGDCGEETGTVSFNIDSDGVMTISGSGAIKAYTRANSYPWYADRAKVKKLVLEEGVTNAPGYAFGSMTNLKDVEFPATLDSWGGTSVFSSSSNIETIKVTTGETFSAKNNILYGDDETKLLMSGKAVSGEIELPSTIKSIEANALDGRSDITKLILPEGLETIGNYAFRGLNKVTELTIPSTVTAIGTYAFANMTEIEKMILPAGVTSLSNYMFSGCSKLNSVQFLGDISTMGTNIFQNCTSLTAFNVSENVTSLGGNTFNGCTSLEKVTLPDGLTAIGASAFQNCSSLTEVNIPGGVKILGASATSSSVFLNCTSLETIDLPDGLTTIGASAFKGCTGLKSIEIPDSVTTIGSMAFQQCTGLTDIALPDDVTTLTATFAGCTNLKTIDLPANLKTLTAKSVNAPGVFSECTSLETIEIPSGVTAITSETFNGCSSLKDLGIGDGVTTIGQSAYMNCTSLVDITIPGTVKSLTGYAFKGCSNLNIVRFGEGMTSFTSSLPLFEECDRLTDIYIPESLESFEPVSFEKAISVQRVHTGNSQHFTFIDGVLYDKDVTKVVYITAGYPGKLVLPNTVTEIGKRCAGYTRALTEIVFPEGLETVGNSAFYYAYGLKRVTLPSTLKTIEDSAFRATGLEEIVIPDSVTSIGAYAFTLCENMRNAIIGNGVKSIPNNAFFNCRKLSYVKFPDEVESIGAQAFSGTMMPEIELPDGCKSVGATALANNTNLNQVILPATITSIPSTAFNGDTGLKNIYFKGTAEEWAALNCRPAYGTVITDYQGVDPELDPAKIAEQPKNAVYEKGETPEPIKVKIDPQGVEGEQYFYTWYKNTTGEPEDGTSVESTAIENGSQCIPETDKIGTVYYYCVITRMVKGYTAERTVSDVAASTVKMDLDGSGSEADPFLVSTEADLKLIYNTVKEGNHLEGVHIKMTDDITLSADWEPIGNLKDGATGSAQGKNTDPFSGIFNGDGHTIKVAEGGKPLFGFVRGAVIKNLDIFGARIDGTGLVNNYERDYEAGGSQSEFGTDAKYIVTIENVTLKEGTKTRESGLIGENNNSQDASSMNPVFIVNCKAESGVEIGYAHDESQIGTFAGRVCGTIINCESSADVYGTERVGGIAGCQDVAMGILHVINSSFHGTVNATGNMAGGIIGTGYRGSAPNALCVEIKNCYADGKVTGKDMVGGILGAEDEVAQCWGNGKGYIYNNLFVGTLSAASDAAYVGGTVGYYRSLNKYTYFGNNFYKEGCGATKGIGGAEFIDTNCKDHETESGTTYFNTENGVSGLPTVTFCDWKSGLNREDDPFGADKDRISKAVSASELADAKDVLAKLNEYENGMHNWVMGDKDYPVTSTEPVCYQLDLTGDYKTDYVIGEDFDTTGMEFKAYWTDGSTTKPGADDVEFSGFNKDERGQQTITATLGAASTTFVVTVLKDIDPDETIDVYITILGDHRHGDVADIHTNKMNTLETWAEEEAFTVSANATAMDVLQAALAKNGLKARVSGNYVAAISDKNGVMLGEFDNGILSGWMYTLNGEHPQLMLTEQYLEDGDEIVMHYTDNYMLESDTLDVSDVVELKGKLASLPEADELTVESEEDVAACEQLFKGLKDNKDKLLTTAEKAKLSSLIEKMKELVAIRDLDNAGEAVGDIEEAVDDEGIAEETADAENQANDAAETVSGAADALAKAEKAAKTVGEEAVTAAENAKAKADGAVKGAEEALAAADAHLENVNAIVESAEKAVADAEKAVESADTDERKAEAQALLDRANAAKAKADAMKQKAGRIKLNAENALADAKEIAADSDSLVTGAKRDVAVKDDIKAIREYADKSKAVKGADSVRVELEALKAENKIRDAATKEEADAALAAGKSAIDKAVLDSQIKAAKNYKVAGFKVKAAKKLKAKLTWKKNSNVNGYQIYRATKKAGKYKKIKQFSSSKKVKLVNKKLKKGKKYFYKMRTFTKVNGKTVYGQWTAVKKIKARK